MTESVQAVIDNLNALKDAALKQLLDPVFPDDLPQRVVSALRDAIATLQVVSGQSVPFYDKEPIPLIVDGRLNLPGQYLHCPETGQIFEPEEIALHIKRKA